jgi:hypothetical protein
MDVTDKKEAAGCEPSGEISKGCADGKAQSVAGRQELFTPGPWVVDTTIHGESIIHVRRDCDDWVSSVAVLWAQPVGGCDVNVANARLIAAAPELLEALQELLESAESVCDGDSTEIPPNWAANIARAAIAKAVQS